jgi:hypothetical protein
LRSEGKAYVLDKTIRAQNDAYTKISTDTGLTGQQLQEYIYYSNLREKTHSTLMVGLENAIVNISNGRMQVKKTDL